MTDRADVFKAWFAVRPATARLAEALYVAGGEVVPHARLSASARQTLAGLNLSLKTLRAAMDPGSIENVLGVGYRMTAAGLADCDKALLDAVQRERAA